MIRGGSYHSAEVDLSLPKGRDRPEDPEASDIARLKRGESSALGDVYVRYHAKLRAFAYRFLGDESVAEDLVHDVFVALQVPSRDSAGRITRRASLFDRVNVSRRHVRSAVRRRSAMSQLAAIPAKDSEIPNATRAGVSSPASCSTRSIDSATIIAPRSSSVRSEGRPAAEVARILGTTESTVRTRVFYAKRKLRELLSAGEHP